MVQYDVEAFMAACERKGLAAKTMGSYEQTLRLFGQFLSVREIERTEEVKRVHIRYACRKCGHNKYQYSRYVNERKATCR